MLSAWLHEGRSDLPRRDLQSDLERRLETVVISRLGRELSGFDSLDVKSCCYEICGRIENRLKQRDVLRINLTTEEEFGSAAPNRKPQAIHLLESHALECEMRHESFCSGTPVQIFLSGREATTGFGVPIQVTDRTADRVRIVLALENLPNEHDLFVHANFPGSNLPALQGIIRPVHHDTAESKMRFLYSVARNTMSEYVRKEKPIDAVSLDDIPPDGLGSTRWKSPENVLHLKDVLKSCTDEEKALLNLRVVEGFGWTEIARMLGRNEGALTVQYFRLKRRLRVLFERPRAVRANIMKNRVTQQAK